MSLRENEQVIVLPSLRHWCQTCSPVRAFFLSQGHFQHPSQASPPVSLTHLNASWQRLLGEPEPTHSVSKRVWWTFGWPRFILQVNHRPWITAQSSSPKPFLPTTIIWELCPWYLCPEGHCSEESDEKMCPPMTSPHGWPLSSLYSYVDSSGHEDICLRFTES